eukprot:365011-Chlamydomonas_euryale.AAC.21
MVKVKKSVKGGAKVRATVASYVACACTRMSWSMAEARRQSAKEDEMLLLEEFFLPQRTFCRRQEARLRPRRARTTCAGPRLPRTGQSAAQRDR